MSSAEIPPFVKQYAAGLADFWSVYEARYDDIQRVTLEMASGHPDFAPLLRAMTPEQSAAANQRSRELLQRAVVGGEWEAYVADMRTQGAMYAKMGVSFSGWYDIVRAFQRAIVPALVAAYARDESRLARAVTAMLEFVDYAMATIAEQYVETKAEVSLRQTARFLDSIVENIPNMVFVKDAKELRFERFNRAGEELLGLPRSALLGKSDFDFFPDEQAEFFQSRDRETLAGNKVVDIAEEPIKTARGERWLHTKKVPVLDETGAPAYLLGISEDITEARQTAAALRQAKEAAETASRELEAFSYSVAHDLRAPLRGINGFSRALLEDCADGLDAQSRDHLQRICAAAERMGQLIDALLSLSRVARSELRRESVDLSRLASDVAARLAGAQAGRAVAFSCDPGLVVVGDENLLRAMLENLLGNAWKFTRKHAEPRVRVGCEGAEGAKTYFVEDNGAGFDMAYAEKLFAPFQRLHTEDAFEGAGIGLATVQRIVRRHGGRVWAEGHVGRGATFRFTLPSHDGATA